MNAAMSGRDVIPGSWQPSCVTEGVSEGIAESCVLSTKFLKIFLTLLQSSTQIETEAKK